jgi:hypothetical protein
LILPIESMDLQIRDVETARMLSAQGRRLTMNRSRPPTRSLKPLGAVPPCELSEIADLVSSMWKVEIELDNSWSEIHELSHATQFLGTDKPANSRHRIGRSSCTLDSARYQVALLKSPSWKAFVNNDSIEKRWHSKSR